MICRTLALCFLASCLQLGTDEPVLLDATGTSGEPIALRIFDGSLDPEATDYRWAFTRVPAEMQPAIVASGSFLEFIPYGRGEYWVDRFVVLGVAENLTHRFIVRVNPGAVVAAIDPMELETPLGHVVTLDASQSFSREGLPLTYEWLNGGSIAIPGLPASGPSLSFTPTRTGEHRVRLRVRDSIFTMGEAVAVIRVLPNAF